MIILTFDYRHASGAILSRDQALPTEPGTLIHVIVLPDREPELMILAASGAKDVEDLQNQVQLDLSNKQLEQLPDIIGELSVLRQLKKIGRPKMFLDVQTFFGCPKKLWTSKTFLDVQNIFGRSKKNWTSKQNCGRPKICLDVQKILNVPKTFGRPKFFCCPKNVLDVQNILLSASSPY